MGASSLTLKQLRYFVQVVETGSISKAADQLNVAQTALGLQIRALEEGLGIRLLHRHHKGVTLKKVGYVVYDRACDILKSVAELKGDVRAHALGERTEISIGLIPSLMEWLGPRAVGDELQKLPGIHLHLMEGMREALVERMMAGEFDYIFSQDLGANSCLRSLPVLRQPLMLVSRPGTRPDPGPVPFTEALKTDLVVRGDSSHILNIVTRIAAEFSMTPNVVYEIDSLAGMKQVIRKYGATSILPGDFVIDAVSRGELEMHGIVDPPVEMTIEFIMHSNRPPTSSDRPLLAFLDALLDDFLVESGTQDCRLTHLTNLVAPR